MAHVGVEPVVTAEPDGDGDVLVRVTPGPPLRERPVDAYLYLELMQRPDGAPCFAAAGLTRVVAAHLAAAVEAEHARLVPLGATWPDGQAHATGLVVTVGDGVQDWLRAGQAVQRLLLTASAAWLTVRCQAGPLELRGARELLGRDHCPDGVPQVILEIGHRTANVA